MKLASLKGSRDGRLAVVSRNLTSCVLAEDIAATLQAALDDWEILFPRLEALYSALNAGQAEGREVLPFNPYEILAPLPRAFQWLDGSAYLPHMERVRRARGATLPAQAESDPLIYQGGSDCFLGPREDIPLGDPAWGLDFESEVAVITSDLPCGVSSAAAGDGIRLLVLVNDLSLRNLIPEELAKGFGFLQSKPPSVLSPVAVTPDELGAAWNGCRLSLPLETWLNGERFGAPEAGEDMAFDFPTLLAHAARTRPLGAGTILGSGTVANRDESRGASCIAERRALEMIAEGAAKSTYLQAGDRVRIEMFDRQGSSIFGAIEQRVQAI